MKLHIADRPVPILPSEMVEQFANCGAVVRNVVIVAQAEEGFDVTFNLFRCCGKCREAPWDLRYRYIIVNGEEAEQARGQQGGE